MSWSVQEERVVWQDELTRRVEMLAIDGHAVDLGLLHEKCMHFRKVRCANVCACVCLCCPNLGLILKLCILIIRGTRMRELAGL